MLRHRSGHHSLLTIVRHIRKFVVYRFVQSLQHARSYHMLRQYMPDDTRARTRPNQSMHSNIDYLARRFLHYKIHCMPLYHLGNLVLSSSLVWDKRRHV
jgi:hypothetical protein